MLQVTTMILEAARTLANLRRVLCDRIRRKNIGGRAGLAILTQWRREPLGFPLPSPFGILTWTSSTIGGRSRKG